MKEGQSLIDFLQTMPLSSFFVRRSPISNKEAQVLYDLWQKGSRDEYGKHTVAEDIDPTTIASLTSKGYVQNQPSRYSLDRLPVARTLEFTDKGKDVIRKIILFKEKSSFEKSSGQVDYESICVAEAAAKFKQKKSKVSSMSVPENWFERLVYSELENVEWK